MATRSTKRLTKSFYLQEDVVQISKDLLGKVLVTNFNGQLTAGKIVETEAYRAPDDKACHAYQNLHTERTSIMFKEGGVAYIYLCYGIHHLFNVVTAKKGMAQAVLVRAIEPLDNIPLMLERSNKNKINRQLTGGPGVMSKALGITKQWTGASLLASDSPIWIEDRGFIIKEDNIIASPRVGVDYAEECALWNWRFRIRDSKFTSPAK